MARSGIVGVAIRTLAPTGIGAILDRIPVIAPGMSPHHLPRADDTDLARQILFVAFKGLVAGAHDGDVNGVSCGKCGKCGNGANRG